MGRCVNTLVKRLHSRAGSKPFYPIRHPDNHVLTHRVDLIACGLEITTAPQRKHRYSILTKQALEKGLSLVLVPYFLDFFKFGFPPHGDFGPRLACILRIILNLNTIRESGFLFRGPIRIIA